MPRICDYEGSKYRTDFWAGQNREYEDQAERLALRYMLPPTGQRLIEIGAGFGRLVDLYQGYDQIVLLDYARTQLEEAQNYLGQDDRFIFVVADVYKLPFVDDLFDTLTMIRVMHHLTDVPLALQELHRIVVPQGASVIEFASKLHLKSLARWVLGRQRWNPFDPDPLEFVELNFDFHPVWMRQQFNKTGFAIQDIRALSYYRLDLLKRHLPLNWLLTLERLAQPTGKWWQLSPSILFKLLAEKTAGSPPSDFFRCPNCNQAKFLRQANPAISSKDELLTCQGCHYRWSFMAGIYDFKTPFATP